MSEGIESVTIATEDREVTVPADRFLQASLPNFEGREPDLTEVRFTGSTGGFGHAYRIGQRVYFLVAAEVVGVNHEEKGKHRDLVRSHKLDLHTAEPVSGEKLAELQAEEAG